MRKRGLSLVFLLIFCISLICMRTTALAEPYTYTVKIYAGKEGTFKSNGTDTLEYNGLSMGENVQFLNSSVQLNKDSKYYVKGIRKSGLDNSYFVPNMNILVSDDENYVVAYGIKNSAVPYTISYVDSDGAKLLPDETYYGNVGDRPVAAYRVIDGYSPKYETLTGTLKKDATNTWVFEYLKDTSKTTSEQRTTAVTQSSGRTTSQSANNNTSAVNNNSQSGTITPNNASSAVNQEQTASQNQETQQAGTQATMEGGILPQPTIITEETLDAATAAISGDIDNGEAHDVDAPNAEIEPQEQHRSDIKIIKASPNAKLLTKVKFILLFIVVIAALVFVYWFFLFHLKAKRRGYLNDDEYEEDT